MAGVLSREDKYLCAIIRKPQEGKTFICLENIRSNRECYHLIITMNTIKSNLQFFERARACFGDKICVFNSREKKKEQVEGFLHAKNVSAVKKHLCGGAEIVIMCAHPKRFEESIIELLEEIEDSKKIKRDVIIHIDEAHAYIPTYRDKIVEMNNNDITHRIYMYSATPFSIWCPEVSVSETEQLFKHIYVVDCAKQFNVVKSGKYFGVRDCEYQIVPKNYPKVDCEIPPDFIERWGTSDQKKKDQRWWGGGEGQSGPFDIGNEVDLISHTEHTLMMLNGSRIKNDDFSLNFVPGFCRKLTHYKIMEMILEIYPRAIVVLINGDSPTGQLFRNDELGVIVGSYIPMKNEPSEQIEGCIQKFPCRPVFITGFHCVGMSVTFINERIGNFDNVIYSHEHYTERPEIQYQLCRFLFNFTSWSEVAQRKIKKTKLFLSSRELLHNCLLYEKQIDKIDTQLSGSFLTQSEVIGDVKVKEKKVPKDRRFDALEPYAKIKGLKKISVGCGLSDKEGLKKVAETYKSFMGKELKGKALPKMNAEGFYECSTTGKKEVFVDIFKFQKTLEGWKKTSNFALKKNRRRYARVYVAYFDNGNPDEYTWFVRMMEIEDNEEVDRIWDTIENSSE